MIKPQSFYERKAVVLLNPRPALERFEGVFGGPSIDLHLWALDARPNVFADDESGRQFLRHVYSALVAWGMHRMGNNGASMPRFADFERSVLPHVTDIQALWLAELPLSETEWSALERTFRGMRATTSQSSIVANSKALFHILPDIIVPIDREYTMKFLELGYWYQTHRTDLASSWTLFRELHEYFFHSILQNPDFQQMPMWKHDMCSRPTKFLDNLIVARVRS